ncbi:MAG TPA: response regulator transcription factor [Candidatus Udaeobacter sp.]|nr:response regulator transcription factor [Candidatus Udaeobacter sp.]
MHILVVEDDVRTVGFLQQSLEEDGHSVDVALDGRTALAKARAKPPHDLIVLDIQIPEPNGLEVCTTIRQEGITAPILILTGRDTPQDVAIGLDAGADDYLVKPFALVELLARVRALTRRQAAPGVKGILQVGSLELDRLKRRVRRSDREIPLAPRQFRLLEYLMLHTGRAVSRSELLREVWNLNFDPESNLVDAHISTLRSALERAGEPRLIHTVRGVGYTLKADPT